MAVPGAWDAAGTWGSLLLVVCLVSGCTEEETPMQARECALPPCAGPPVGTAGSVTAGSGIAGMPALAPATGGGGEPGGDAPIVAPSDDGVPCDVAGIVSDHCTGCHQSPVKYGAAMPLMTLADFHAPAKSDPSREVYQVIPERLDPIDPTRRMPQPPLDALTADQKQIVNAWLSAGAPAAADACPIAVSELSAPSDPTSGGASLGSGGAHIDPIEYDDPDMQCYPFQTHARGDVHAPYMATREEYINFDFEAPWDGTVYMRATKIANDPNSHVIHHWLLFKLSGAAVDGAVSIGTGAHPTGTLVYAWGPGASPLYLDPDVGMPLEGNVGYQLEAHFNTAAGPGTDQSGAEVCVTPHEPEHVAELVWVGSDSILGTRATGTCRPRGPFPIHVIAAQPHMHKLGTHMKVTVNRAGGGQDVVHDLDFNFDTQQYYVKDFLLGDGDTMTTECSYSGFATFGTSTNSEMCYFFSLAWPAGALRSGASLVHGPNTCM